MAYPKKFEKFLSIRYMSLVKKIAKRLTKTKKKFVPPTESFLMSGEYDKMMRMHLPFPGTYDLHEAQNKTQNFEYRHHSVNHKLCIFRWRGIQKHKERILKLATNKDYNAVDLGGAACPLGFNTIVVDHLPKDAFGRKVLYRDLDEVPGQIDFLFSSHTLEHIPELESVFQKISDKMQKEGICIFHVPSFYCERWRVGTHSNKAYHDHCWTFGLSDDSVPLNELNSFVAIDSLINKYLDVTLAEHCGDDSIYIEARPKK